MTTVDRSSYLVAARTREGFSASSTASSTEQLLELINRSAHAPALSRLARRESVSLKAAAKVTSRRRTGRRRSPRRGTRHEETSEAITKLSPRELNQDASKAKRAAKRGPVFITNRGRPSEVLLTAEEYQRITSARKASRLIGKCHKLLILSLNRLALHRPPDLS